MTTRADIGAVANPSPELMRLAFKLDTGGKLTPKEQARAAREIARDAARRRQLARSTLVSMAPVSAAFRAAVGAGIERPVMRLADVTLSLSTREPGTILVQHVPTREFVGTIRGAVFDPSYVGVESTAPFAAAALDIRRAIVEYAARTGNCALCGRPSSLADAVCRMKWGII